jgi:ABC-type molybdate transport system ATPase subunit
VHVLDRRPAQLVATDRSRVALDRLVERGGALQSAILLVVGPLDEQQVGELLDHLQRVGHPARPHRIPDPVDLVAHLP